MSGARSRIEDLKRELKGVSYRGYSKHLLQQEDLKRELKATITLAALTAFIPLRGSQKRIEGHYHHHMLNALLLFEEDLKRELKVVLKLLALQRLSLEDLKRELKEASARVLAHKVRDAWKISKEN